MNQAIIAPVAAIINVSPIRDALASAPKVRKPTSCSVCHEVGHNKTKHNTNKCTVCNSSTHMTNFHARILEVHQTLLERGTYLDSVQGFHRYLKINFAPYDLTEVARFLGANIEAQTANQSRNRQIEHSVKVMLIAYYYCLSHSDPTIDALYAQFEHPQDGFFTRYELTWYIDLVNTRANFETMSRLRQDNIARQANKIASEMAIEYRYKYSIISKPLAKENPEKMKDECECPICYDTFETKNLVLTECGHNYCSPCYKSYMLSVNAVTKPCCSICRTIINTVTVFA